MNTHLYIVAHEIDGECYTAPCVGDKELEAHVEMAERFGAALKDVIDVESELRTFIWCCCFEGRLRNWSDANE
jgi:hypothetical protein